MAEEVSMTLEAAVIEAVTVVVDDLIALALVLVLVLVPVPVLVSEASLESDAAASNSMLA